MRSLEVSACSRLGTATTNTDHNNLNRPGSDSTLLRRRQNKSNTITVLVIIGAYTNYSVGIYKLKANKNYCIMYS